MLITIHHLIKNVIFLGPPRVYKYHETRRISDELCVINDANEFFKSFKNIYPKERELKVEHKGTRVTIKDNIFIYKLSTKDKNFHSS